MKENRLMKFRSIPPFLLSVAFLMGMHTFARAEAHFTARMDGLQENPPVATGATGTGSFTLSSQGLHFAVTVNGLSGPITAAHFHMASRGVNGGVLRDIAADFTGDNTAIGLWRPTDAQPLNAAAIEALERGDLYVNVHTAANPGGEIRGQVDVSAGTFFTANLTGDQENPPIAGGGRGTGTFVLHQGRSELTYKITVTGLSGGITAAHIHGGAIGANGGVIQVLAFVNGTSTGTWAGMTAAQVRELMAGNLYVNIHTAANPGGEIRGQILLSAGFGFSARIDGAQENPAVPGPQEGTGSFTLTPEGLQFDLTVSELSGPITAAHFHRAPAGVNGPVVRDILPDFGISNTASGLWRRNDAQPLTDALICDLLMGNIYVNVHTAANPGGEARGQVLLGAGNTTFTATLTGDEENPALAVNGRGTGTFRLTPAGLEYRVTVNGLTGGITAAHFHLGRIGANGGVSFTITGDFPPPPGMLTAVGVWTPASAPPLTPALIKSLLVGDLYVNVHTAANPGGEIRGQVTLASGTGLQAPMTVDQETGAPPAGGTGTASSTLTDNGLVFSVTVNNLSGAPTAEHIHNRTTGADGPVVRSLAAEWAGNHAEGVWQAIDPDPLTPALVDELLEGNCYFNVHTAAAPAGEVRGQALVGEGWGYSTSLHGGNEVGPVSTGGTGSASLTLTELGIVHAMTVDDLSSPITAAHFHNAPAGVNGAVVRDIFADFAGNSERGNWQPNDAQSLTPALICELIQGELYMNVHTTANPAGEVRGNLGSRVATGVDEGSFSGISMLMQNFPNPFVGHTAIAYRLPSEGFVTLRLYDVQGRTVATLVDGYQSAGLHEISFDANRLPSGIYLYRLESGGRVETRKLLVDR
jgi:Cu/Zn superoxide dismutase